MLKIETIPAAQVPEALLLKNHSQRNENWDRLAEALQSAKVADWVRVLPSELPGKDIECKRGNVMQAMRNGKLEVATCRLGAHLWLRMRTADEPKRKPITKTK